MELDLNEIELINNYFMDKYTGKKISKGYMPNLSWSDKNVEESKQFKLLDKLLKERIKLEERESEERVKRESEKLKKYWNNQVKKQNKKQIYKTRKIKVG